MENIILQKIQFVFNLTGIDSFFCALQFNPRFLLLGLGLIACFFGIKLYRLFFSIVVYLGILFLSIFILQGHVLWSSVVLIFSIVGLSLAIFAINWMRSGAVTIVFIFMSMIIYRFGMPVLPSLLIGLIFAVISFYLSMEVVILVTAFWGAQMFFQTVMALISIEIAMIPDWIYIVFLATAGAAIQYTFARKDTWMFEQRYYLLKRDRIKN